MQRLAVRPFLFILLLVLCTYPAKAQISGANDPTFQSAVELWLDGDDETSLPAMAELARNGNTAARLLLPQIAFLPWDGSEYLEALSREDRKNSS